MATGFTKIYKRFYSKVTDDMYMELDQAQTDALLQELLINAIDWFEFPRVNINDYNVDNECFNVTLSTEEINILATYMMLGWFDQQLASVENTRMKYSGSDFKFTSQANHMSKLSALRKEYERIGFHLQRLYKRRKADKNGVMKSTFGSIMATSVRAGNVGSVSTGSNSGSTSNGADSEDKWEDMDEPTPPAEDETWEDMEDLPEASTDSDSWGDMEDLPSDSGTSDNWGSL